MDLAPLAGHAEAEAFLSDAIWACAAEAAAATAVTMDIVVSALKVEHRPPPIVFRADKPFLFILRDRRTGLILFMGRYVAPPAPELPGASPSQSAC